MGRGDQRTRKGKIRRGTHGKTRPRPRHTPRSKPGARRTPPSRAAPPPA